MFDLITQSSERPLRERSPVSKIVSVVVHAIVLTAVVVVPLFTATTALPDVPTMMAFVAATPAVPPPPPPPPRSVSTGQRPAEPPKTTARLAAPIEAPGEIRPERAARDSAAEGVEGGVEGGIPGGVVGGIVGGLVSLAPPPPPPPPPPPAPTAPVRIGGQISAPALVTRVEPTYPDLALMAQLQGIVILEAVVDTDGCVQTVTVLRSRHPLLDAAAVNALKQWRYSPLVLNGIPTRFVLTVTFNFSVGAKHG